MTYRFKDIIDMFLKGERSGRAGSKSSPGNLVIHGDQLFHYTTPIMERVDNQLIVNLSQYSIETGRVQKLIKQILSGNHYLVVRKVPRDYEGSLTDFPVNEEVGKA